MDGSPSLESRPEGKCIYSQDEVALHNLAGVLWVVIDHVVYDLSSFQDEHPGGAKSMSKSDQIESHKF